MSSDTGRPKAGSADEGGAAAPVTSCPMDYILRQLMGPWTTYILYVLRTKGPLRFGALKKEITGISAKMLTERLRTLESGGLIYRSYETTVPPKVTYGLAPRGHELQPILDSFVDLGSRWQVEDKEKKVAPKPARQREVAE